MSRVERLPLVPVATAADLLGSLLLVGYVVAAPVGLTLAVGTPVASIPLLSPARESRTGRKTMSKKNHSPGPVPPGNRPQKVGHNDSIESQEQSLADHENDANTTDTFQAQDPKRRLGGFEEAGEHSRQQPGRANDGDHHSQ